MDFLTYELTGDLMEVVGGEHTHQTPGERTLSSFQEKVVKSNQGRLSWWWELVEEETENLLRDLNFFTSRGDWTNWALPEEEHDKREALFQELCVLLWGFTRGWGWELNSKHKSFTD